MIYIGAPYIAEGHDSVKLISNVKIDDVLHRIYIAVDPSYAPFLVKDRSDGMLIGILHYALEFKHDICCEAPISEELLYGIQETLVPALQRGDQRIHVPTIECELISVPTSGAGIGTGISCGVDSFNTICSHYNTAYPHHNLTHLAVMNTGSFNAVYRDAGISHIKEKIWSRAKHVADELLLPLVKIDSNIALELEQNHYLTHTYTDAFAIHYLAKLWKRYYYASAYPYDYVSFQNNLSHDVSRYEQLLLNCLSTSSLQICLDGAAGTRNDKIRKIADFPAAQKYLHVCLRKADNCGKCEKCRRTMLAMDAEGKLDSFRSVFPVDYYMEHKAEYYDSLCRYAVLKHEEYTDSFTKLYPKHKEEFDIYLARYEVSALMKRGIKLDEALQRWIKYGKIYKSMINHEALQAFIVSFLQSKCVTSVAFYGDGDLRRFIETLLNGTGIEIRYLVEDHVKAVHAYPSFSRELEDFSDVDAVIVTDIIADESVFDKITRSNPNCLLATDLLSAYSKQATEIILRQQNRTSELEKSLTEKEKLLRNLKNSKEYKLGEAVAYLPKKAYRMFK